MPHHPYPNPTPENPERWDCECGGICRILTGEQIRMKYIAIKHAQRARRASRSTSSGSHKPEAIESAIYRYVIDPRRTKRGGYTPEERDRAQRLTTRWATTWLSDIVDWIRVSGGEHPDIAVKLSKAGLTPADAELRLGFGRIDRSRDTIIERMIKGNLGIKDAVRQVQEFRRSERSTGS